MIMSLPDWIPPSRTEPSQKWRGETSTEVIYLAAGRATSLWEHAESALIKLFQLFCESRSLAVCRAYGSIVSASGRAEALNSAAAEFFERRRLPVPDSVKVLIREFGKAGGFRNKIAHGMAAGCHAETGEHLGYYLMPPSYAMRHRGTSRPSEAWWLTAKYFFLASEINSCSSRFETILNEAMRLMLKINEEFSVLPPAELHP